MIWQMNAIESLPLMRRPSAKHDDQPNCLTRPGSIRERSDGPPDISKQTATHPNTHTHIRAPWISGSPPQKTLKVECQHPPESRRPAFVNASSRSTPSKTYSMAFTTSSMKSVGRPVAVQSWINSSFVGDCFLLDVFLPFFRGVFVCPAAGVEVSAVVEATADDAGRRLKAKT